MFLRSILIANTDFNCLANYFNLPRSVFAIDVSFFRSGYELSLFGWPISFFKVLQLLGSLVSWRLWIPFWMFVIRWLLICFLIFSETAFRADLRKGFLVLIKALLIFLFCFISSWIEKDTLVFGWIEKGALLFALLGRERYVGSWFNRFFRETIVNIYNRVSKNGGRIVNDVDRISASRRY